MNLQRRLYASETAHRLLDDDSDDQSRPPEEGETAGSVGAGRRRADRELRALLRSIRNDELRTTDRPVVNLGMGEVVGYDVGVALDGRPSRPAVTGRETRVGLPDGSFVVAERGARADDAGSARAMLARIADDGGAVALNAWLLRRGLHELYLRLSSVGVRVQASITTTVAIDRRFIEDDDFLPIVKDAVRRTGLQPRQLCLSVPLDACIERDWSPLQRLKSHGVSIALEGLSLGSPSAELLRRYPFDIVRLDPSVFDDVGVSNGAPVRNLVRLAHNLGSRVLADGVDDGVRRELCRWAGCDLILGAAAGGGRFHDPGE